ncbi:BCCT family transporter [Rhodococcus rhodnii]|uniref:BCCT family glycine betaine transporter n=2 Tax=Rhodococcus rhodnii TaxID=38312 RepID=R7WJ21_9NOCA|nr:BCCT family transporter [Rhodococcus rhodnii]EOM75223.1 BCCT family glycine betaine transporter [Rhodococcus rhodnii LMG 5362]TXG89244.1 BCCT family transporter [Rhodococcus rhodnii]
MLTKLHDALRLRTSPGIFFSASAVALVFVVATIVATSAVDSAFESASSWIMTNLGWFYILGVSSFLIFLIYIAMSRYGSVRLGSDDERPEHSNLTWFTMLFAAGIGTILMFWGVAEPISHFAEPPMGDVEPGTAAAANEAIGFTLYHFGLHTWTIFALPALGFGYFIYKRKMPPRVSSIFGPILGSRIYGPIGKTIDVVAVVGTIFGVAVSVGLGVLQINAGVAQLFGWGESGAVQLLIIFAVTVVAGISVALGLEKGIKRLSNINIGLAVMLLIFVLVTGPTLFLLKGTVEATGTYLSYLPTLSFWNDTFADTGWQNTWTVFYWAWTITWSPFVGIFIARISRGRTIREFVFGVLALPVTFSVAWFGIFGMGSFHIELEGDGGLVERVVDDGDIPGALFEFLSNYPAATLISAIAILIVVVFFITSVDSASLVLDSMASGADDRGPLHQRLYWCVLMGLVAATLLVATGEDGLEALQMVIIVVGLPFFVMGWVMMFSLLKGIKNDLGAKAEPVTRQWEETHSPEELERQEAAPSPEPIAPTYHIPDENGHDRSTGNGRDDS